jgi:hypothetical protein
MGKTRINPKEYRFTGQQVPNETSAALPNQN